MDQQASLSDGFPWFILIPVVFMLGMGVVIFFIVRFVRSRAKVGAADTAAISSQAQGQSKGARAFFLIFALFGLGFLVPFFIRPAIRILQARNWVETPCVIESSQVESHSDGEGGVTYRPAIKYRYEFAGRPCQSGRRSFFGGSSSGRTAKQSIVDQYPAGAERRCWVNPADPTQAVLDRGFRSDMLFGLIPLVFVALGVGGFIWSGGRRFKPAAAPVAASGQAGRSDESESALRPAHSRLGRALGAVGVALFWNGISWTGWLMAYRDRTWVAVLFLSVFVLIGSALAGVALYSLLALANPRPQLTLRPGRLRAESRHNLSWRLSGLAGRLRKLTISLEGRECATYQRGTSTSTDRQLFARVILAETTLSAAIPEGAAAFQLPASAAPSFKAKNNQVEWFLRVHGDIPFWPDLNEEYPVEMVGPSAGAPRSAFRADTGRQATSGENSALTLSLAGGRTLYSPSEPVEGVASWFLTEPPRSAEVRLFWFTRGKGTRDVGVADTARFDAPAGTDSRPFALRLPDLPWSMEGRLISIIWAVELVVEPDGRVVRQELVCSPTGEPVALAALPAPEEDRRPPWQRWLNRIKGQ